MSRNCGGSLAAATQSRDAYAYQVPGAFADLQEALGGLGEIVGHG